ncbi:GTP cyclohydrolase I [Nocardia gipuzkoensis]
MSRPALCVVHEPVNTIDLPAAERAAGEFLTALGAGCDDEHLQPQGVGVVIEAERTCMTLRGVQATGATNVTSTTTG